MAGYYHKRCCFSLRRSRASAKMDLTGHRPILILTFLSYASLADLYTQSVNALSPSLRTAMTMVSACISLNEHARSIVATYG